MEILKENIDRVELIVRSVSGKPQADLSFTTKKGATCEFHFGEYARVEQNRLELATTRYTFKEPKHFDNNATGDVRLVLNLSDSTERPEITPQLQGKTAECTSKLPPLHRYVSPVAFLCGPDRSRWRGEDGRDDGPRYRFHLVVKPTGDDIKARYWYTKLGGTDKWESIDLVGKCSNSLLTVPRNATAEIQIAPSISSQQIKVKAITRPEFFHLRHTELEFQAINDAFPE